MLRYLNEGRGRASIWITLEGLNLDASTALLFPSRATGARGFHIWWGGVAGGVSAEGTNIPITAQLPSLQMSEMYYLKAVNSKAVLKLQCLVNANVLIYLQYMRRQ